MPHRFSVFISLIVILLSPSLFAGTTGKISGKISDAKSGEPIVGASIMLGGTTIGTSSDFEGIYVLPNVSPGRYSVKISAIGYQKATVQDVLVNIDFTTKVDFSLEPEAVGLEEVVVISERPMVRTDLTSSHASVDASEIRALPVENITAILTTQAGIIQDAGGALHFRGGREDEVAYTVNGVSVNNPFDNRNNFNIATNAIQELSVVQGTFNAEYGNALSGVVEQGLKEGGEKYLGQISYYFGDRVSTHTDIFPRIDRIDPFSHQVFEGTIGGPIPVPGEDVSFFISGRYDHSKGWLYGKKEHTPADMPDVSTENWIIPMTGNGDWVPMNGNYSLTLTNRFTYRATNTRKINYDFIFNQDLNNIYNHGFRYNPDGTQHSIGNDVLHAIEYADWFDNKTSFRVKASYSRNKYERFRYKDLLYEHYFPSENLKRVAGISFYLGGALSSQYEEMAETYLAKADIVSQISSRQEIKTGVEAKFPQMFMLSFPIERDTNNVLVPTIPDRADPRNESYARYPKQYSAYIQDKLEYESIVLNLGLRYDYFLANSKYIQDIYDPTSPKVKAKAKQTVSPRIGVSYPITDRGIIHFSYGHFFQMPQLQNLYANPDFKIDAGATYGNANLNPQKTVTYEVGLQQQLTDNLAFNVTGFYKDVRDLFAVQTIRVSDTYQFNMYVNKDYANIRGATFSLTKRRLASDLLALTLDYTYQSAEGNDIISASAFFIDRSSGRESEKIVVPLGWDQTHSLNTTIAIGETKDWNVSLISRVGSGQPYTPVVTETQVLLKPNTGRKPMRITVDMLAQKEFDFEGIIVTLFAKVFNLFDTRNQLSVFSTTGTAEPGKDDISSGNIINEHVGVVPGIHSYDEYLRNPTLYSSPREVRVGVSLDF